ASGVTAATGARDRASAASWLPSSWTAAAPDSTSAAGSPEGSVKAYGDQRPGNAAAGMASGRGGPGGNVARVTRGRTLPAARAASSSVTASPVVASASVRGGPAASAGSPAARGGPA